MAKRPMTLKVRIPQYKTPRNQWRKEIHKAVMEKLQKTNISYSAVDTFEIIARIHFDRSSILSHDVDNRLKDILDALQGRAGGSKKLKLLHKIIPNDNQIYKVIIEKLFPRKSHHSFGHLIIKKYKKR
jgi:hypothetical protein